MNSIEKLLSEAAEESYENERFDEESKSAIPRPPTEPSTGSRPTPFKRGDDSIASKPTINKNEPVTSYDSDDDSVDYQSGNETPELITACYRGDIRLITKLLDNEKISINAKDRHGWTAFHWAASKGQFDALNLLVKHVTTNSGPGTCKRYLNQSEALVGYTPLHVSANS